MPSPNRNSIHTIEYYHNFLHPASRERLAKSEMKAEDT